MTGPASFPQTQDFGSDSFKDAALVSRWRLPLDETEQVWGAGGLGRVYQLRDAYFPVCSVLAASSCHAMLLPPAAVSSPRSHVSHLRVPWPATSFLLCLFVLFRPLMEWMAPTYLGEGNLLYSGY